MKDKYYICVHVDSCQHAGTKNCVYGAPGGMSKIILDGLCYNGVFNPQLVMRCAHPKVNNEVILVNTSIEGNYSSIWTQ